MSIFNYFIMKTVKLHDKTFQMFIEASAIDEAIENMAEQMNQELKNDSPLFISVLNGSFMFTSDLLKHITIPGTEVSFVRISSYAGTSSTEEVRELIGLQDDISGRNVVILEDIIDSGRSMVHLIDMIKQRNPKQILVSALFYKPEAITCPIEIDYCSMELENDFVVGRGLDYNGLGRNLPDLYILIEE